MRFTKLGKVRWTSHRDLARIWERVIRRAGLPIAYSQGFSPHPKLHFGLALSTGHESLAEYLDLDLDDAAPNLPGPADLLALPARLSPLLPVGVDVTAVAVIPTSTPSLQQAVDSCEWEIEIRSATPADVSAAVARLLGATELVVTRERKGKAVNDDIRPYVLDLTVLGPTEHGTMVHAHLATQPRGLRAGELIAALDPGWEEGQVRRTTQWTSIDGARHEPLEGPAAATSAPHEQVRAS
ncbi:MAG: TIGR03936 family radical SAM-associated protein [Acidimicrobiales bacterium]